MVGQGAALKRGAPARPTSRRRLGAWLGAATVAGSLLGGGASRADPAVYKVDVDHSGVGFSIRHFVSNVPGRFTDFAGILRFDRQNPAASSVELTVQASSIDTANNDRDDHLRGPDFFDVQKFPTLSFTSVSVSPKDASFFEVMGDLTLHGVTKRVTLPVQFLGVAQAPRAEKAGFETTFTLNRKDFGINWNRVIDAAGAVLGDEVRITISIEANREVAEAKAEGEKPKG
jgi:polyisoprenoid-binding protein YceI